MYIKNKIEKIFQFLDAISIKKIKMHLNMVQQHKLQKRGEERSRPMRKLFAGIRLSKSQKIAQLNEGIIW